MGDIVRLPVEGAKAPSSSSDMPTFHPRPKPGTSPDDALFMWWARALSIVNHWNSEDHDDSDEYTDRLSDLERECLEAIATLPAATPSGMAVKARMLIDNAPWGSGPRYCEDCVWSLLADLERGAS